MLALLLLLASASSRIVLIDEIVEVGPARWRDFAIELRQRPAVIDCRFQVVSGGSGVRVMLMSPEQLAALREGRPHRPLIATSYQSSGSFRMQSSLPGEYFIVIDNGLEGRGPARVRLAVALGFDRASPQSFELSPLRRGVIIVLSLAFLFGVAFYVFRKLKQALLKRDQEDHVSY